MKSNLINIAVAGATGFVGLDLVYLLTKHPKVKIMLKKKIQENKFKSLIKGLRKNYQNYQKLKKLVGIK